MALIQVLAALLLDWRFGDPYNWPHPVRYIGKFIALWDGMALRMQKRGRRPITEALLGAAGCAVTVAGAFFCVWAVLEALGLIWPGLKWLGELYFLYAALAARCLANEARRVERALAAGDLPEARRRLGGLVGRDTRELSGSAVIRATVETVSENLTDGVVSPLFWAALGSPFGLSAPLCWAYKACNTLDSMVGYRNERYRWLGWASARLDDGMNFIPARLSGIALVLAAQLLWKRGTQGWRALLRDHRRHRSPNGGWTEAAAAGILGIQLGGGSFYGGQWVEKPIMGDDLRPPVPAHIGQICWLLWPAVLIALAPLTVLWLLP